MHNAISAVEQSKYKERQSTSRFCFPEKGACFESGLKKVYVQLMVCDIQIWIIFVSVLFVAGDQPSVSLVGAKTKPASSCVQSYVGF